MVKLKCEDNNNTHEVIFFELHVLTRLVRSHAFNRSLATTKKLLLAIQLVRSRYT